MISEKRCFKTSADNLTRDLGRSVRRQRNGRQDDTHPSSVDICQRGVVPRLSADMKNQLVKWIKTVKFQAIQGKT